jgi:hypothetical protein
MLLFSELEIIDFLNTWGSTSFPDLLPLYSFTVTGALAEEIIVENLKCVHNSTTQLFVFKNSFTLYDLFLKRTK